MNMNMNIIHFESLGINDIDQVGGKNASLGEMISHLSKTGVRVPGGFATTAYAYRHFLAQNGLDNRIESALSNLDVDDVKELAKVGQSIRQWIIETPFPDDLETDICSAYQTMAARESADFSVAVRSSATAEDLPDASFAGQQETFLNVTGIDEILLAVKQVFASLFNDRAISYRVHQGFAHNQVALSAGIQRMVRSDSGSSGVMFTLDTESGFTDVVFITTSYGLGEMIVQGAVNPDEFYVYKPNLGAGKPAILRRSLGKKALKMIFDDVERVATVAVDPDQAARFSLTDKEIEELARLAVVIEKHYAKPMDIEWGKDGLDGQLYILQARPETIHSRPNQELERYNLRETADIIATGRSIGQRIGSGTAKVIMDISEMDQVHAGDVLITDMTDPDWEPIMKRAAAIVTNRGGRTCHAAIIARELGVPAVVGCGNATELIANDQPLTVSCAEGDIGKIYAGILEFDVEKINFTTMPELPVKIMMNIGNPERAFSFASLPNAGVGLARLEFIINRMIGIHPKALLEYAQQPEDLQQLIKQRIAGYDDPVEFYVERLVEGIATLGAAFAPKPVIVRMSDFKSNEYANLIGGEAYEPDEENPMIGFRGASRYISASFQDCFELECRALRKVRDDMGLTNINIMIPFVRTLQEAEQVVAQLQKNGLERGKNGLKLIMMCEIPSNAILAARFLEYFDGFSIGSNDLTQLTLGLDRDSALVASSFDERNDAVKALIHQAIQTCLQQKKYIGICGQGPSDYPDFALWLQEEGIESISLNPDTVIETWMFMAKHV
jgi:pyruvate, water dikinase